MSEDKLFNAEEESYGTNYKPHIIEQYKLYIEMMDRTSQRRMNSNTFFIAINSFLLTLYNILKITHWVHWLTFAIIGVAINIIWTFLINSYKTLNSGKFDVIHEIEKKLPLALFLYEWDILNAKKYKPLSKIERRVPILFIILFVVIGIMQIIVMFSSK